MAINEQTIPLRNLEIDSKDFVKFRKYLNDFYGRKGIYPNKYKKDLQARDILKAIDTIAGKNPRHEWDWDSLDRELVRDELINMRKFDYPTQESAIKEISEVGNFYSPNVNEDETQDREEIVVGDYQTKFFDVCPGATSVYKDIESKGVDMDMAERSAKLHDALFAIEKHVLRDDEKGSELEYMTTAQNIADQIMSMAKMMDLESEHSYIQSHVDTIEKALKGDEEVEPTQDTLDEKFRDNRLDRYFEFLDDLRMSGRVNMMASPKILSQEFGIDKGFAKDIVKKWMRSYESVSEGKKFKQVKKDRYGNHLEPQFKKGDKVTYLGNKGVITRVNKESNGVYSYDVSYDKGNGKTKASNIFNKSGDELKESVNEVNNRLNNKVKQLLDHYLTDIDKNSPEYQEAIMLVMRGALTDANFHSEAKQLKKYFSKAGKKYTGTKMEDVIEDKGIQIAGWAKWNGHDIIDAFSFYTSKTLGGSFGNKLQSLKESINEVTKISSSDFKKLEDAITKVSPKIKTSLNPKAPGGFEIQIPDDSKWELHTTKVQQLIQKITGDQRNGTIFYEGNVNENEFVTFVDTLKGKKLLKVLSSQRAAKMFIKKHADNILSKRKDIESVGFMSKKDWDSKEAKYAVNERIVKIAKGKYDVKKTNFKFLQRVSKRGLEGIVFLGAGGDLNKWVNGINDLWNKDKIGSGLIEDKMMGLYQINTSGGRTDLVMIFKTKSQIEIGKLAMWRLRFGDASWLSDYVVNYKDQHDESINEVEYKDALDKFNKELEKNSEVRKAAKHYKKSTKDVVKALQSKIKVNRYSDKSIKQISIDYKEDGPFSSKVSIKLSKDYKQNESVEEGKKRFKRQDGIGKAKYTISYHDGKKKHKDGSDFFDIKIFKNKKDLSDFVGTLVKQGYKPTNESVNEEQINEWKLQLDLGKVNPSEFEKWADSSLQKKHKIKVSGSGKNWTITGKGNDDRMGSSANWITQLLGKSWKGGNMRVTHKESVNEADVVGKTIFSDGKGKLFFGYYKTDDGVQFVDYKTWKKLGFKDVSKGDTNKERVIKAILKKQKQFNKKVDYNMWSKKGNPSFEDKMDWFIKNGWISNVTKRGIKENIVKK